MANAVIKVRNFGPIKSGQFELRPLTIFLGQNNTGKTYCALLVYSIYQAILGRIPGTMPSISSIVFSRSFERAFSKDFRRIREMFELNPNDINLSNFPEFTKEQLTKLLEESFSRFPQSIEIALNKYLQYAQPNELICKNLLNPQSMLVDVKDPLGNSYLKLRVAPRGKKVHVSTSLSTGQYILKYSQLEPLIKSRMSAAIISYEIFASSFPQLFSGFNNNRVYYLPAARSGTLQVWPLISTYIAETLPRVVGLHPIQLGTVPGITSDFMTTLYNLIGAWRQPTKSVFSEVIDFMEKEILGGTVSLSKRGDLLAPTFLYSIPGLTIDLSRASSMVAELAPLDALMKRMLSPPYELVIIDEPEAHLHPENQRKVAHLIAKLVRRGINVICTTHSHIFLHQISNLVLASDLDSKKKRKLGLTDSTLAQSDVGVYLFQKEDSLVNIKETPLIKAAGYAEDEYVKVYEELLDEYHEVSH